MGLLNTKVKIGISYKLIDYYEELGYEIPRIKNKQGKMIIDSKTKMQVMIKDLPNGSHMPVNIKCDKCGKEYQTPYRTYIQHNHNGKTYCRNCSSSVFCSGENNVNYNPNKTDEERKRKRNYVEYTTFIKKVLARDNYTCQCCGKTNVPDLQVHHLDGYDWCIEKRIDETNGITLCINCHNNFHNIYGKGNNTFQQFEEWFGNISSELSKYNGELSTSRLVYCYEEDKIYKSVKEYSIVHNCSDVTVRDVCSQSIKINKNGSPTCSFSVKGLHVFWYDEYINMTDEEIQFRVLRKRTYQEISKSVVCLTNNTVYKSIADASRHTNCSETGISNCCHHKYRNTHSKSGEKFQFMFLEEYMQVQNKVTN